MGTNYSIKISRLPEGLSQEKLQKDIHSTLERINDQMSTYRPKSEISRFNRSRDLGWFSVSADTARVVRTAMLISMETRSAFDVTVSPLVNLWGFGPESRDRIVPDNEEIKAAKAKTGSRKLKARLSPPALRKLHADLKVDLSAIAKGFGVDKVAGLLDKHGIVSYLVEIGGEIRARGLKKDGINWTVGIERPDPDQSMIQEVISLRNQALATSGDYRNFFAQGGKRYSHTIDPTTGRPVEHGLASVTVVADQCMLADAWATALMVLGPERGYQLAVDQDLAALFIVKAQEGFVQKTTSVFEKILTL